MAYLEPHSSDSEVGVKKPRVASDRDAWSVVERLASDRRGGKRGASGLRDVHFTHTTS
jgi:hypothetical protein